MLGRGTRESKTNDTSRAPDRTRGALDEERRVAAWIGASIVIRGRVTSSEDMTIAGRIEGDVEVRDNHLVIARGAHIAGNVHARSVTVDGQVEGDIRAERIEVGETGSVYGEIVAPRMSIGEGAVLRGRLSIAQSAE